MVISKHIVINNGAVDSIVTSILLAVKKRVTKFSMIL